MTANVQLPAEWQLKPLVQRHLATVPYKPGETVQFGWFIFRVANADTPPELESLDFRKMASFTTDFSAAESVRALQSESLRRCGVLGVTCTLRQTALVSRSYAPGREDAFLVRQRSSADNDSGWYVGVREEERDLD
ncbi:MAG: hypothetical protein NTV51_03705, partial [Verrucomicrobia bacterium]|nr:hypothetical protein [Verrucomicrobiota bacterium]